MSRLIETIRLEDGTFGNLTYHQHRMDNAFGQLYSRSNEINLERLLVEDACPSKGLFKCRVVYDLYSHVIQYESYTIRPVISLMRVEQNEIVYDFKYEDRLQLNQAFYQKATCDDVLIIKEGLVTDTSYANIVFKKKDGDWITPNSCLLKGTMRQFLLDINRIKEEIVLSSDVSKFVSYKLINSMLRWDSAERDVSNIV